MSVIGIYQQRRKSGVLISLGGWPTCAPWITIVGLTSLEALCMKRGLLLLSAICVFLAVVEAVAQSANSSTLTILHSFAGGTDGGYL
jgi:hypothetical protein